MKKTMLTLVLCGTVAAGLTISAPTVEAKPGGCLKYGAAGAVAGHAVGHGVRGFMAGCAAGMYRRHLYNKQQRQMKNGGPAPSTTGTPAATAPAANPM